MIVAACALVFLAVFNRFYAIPDGGRYFQPLLPLLFAAWGYTAVHFWNQLSVRSPRARWAWYGTIPFAWCALSALSLLSLSNYYAESYASGRNNASMLAILETLRGEPEVPVLIDYELAKLRTGRGGNVAEDLICLFALDRRPTRLVTVQDKESARGLANLLRSTPKALLISFARAPDLLGTDFEMESLISARFPCVSCTVPQDFSLFRWER